MKYDFGTISERDMDMLFLNAFGTDKGFLKLFIEKTDLPKGDYTVSEVYLSKADKDGESDITLIIECSGKKYGLLIEDKIDAIAMPEQPERYVKRGNRGIKNGDYDKFFSFIVCPEKYYKNNDAAKKYDYEVMYEEIRTYFSKKTDPASAIYFQQISQAIDKAKRPPKVEINANARVYFGKTLHV